MSEGALVVDRIELAVVGGPSQRVRETAGTVGARLKLATALLVLTALVPALTSCTVESPVNPTEAPTGTTVPSGEPVPEEISESIEAVLVVASVDTDGTTVSASGYVAGTLEEGRTCTFRFSQDGAEFDQVSESIPDRITTSCGFVQVPIGQFVRGTASVKLVFDGTDGVVESAPMEFEVP